MTARQVVILLRSLHQEATWRWRNGGPDKVRQGCSTCHANVAYSLRDRVSWPCETAALLDSIEATLN